MRLADLARLRGAAYRFLGGVFLYPDVQWIAALPQMAGGLLAESRWLAAFVFWGPLRRLLSSLQETDGTSRSALEAAYVGNFVVASEVAPCLPYESAYLPREAAGWTLAELDREYALAGFPMDPSRGEHPDHAAVELEFMSLLCGEEAEAWRRRNLGDGVERLDREAGFLDRHLGRWFPEFALRTAERDGDGFYTRASEAAHAFIAHDRGLITALHGRYRKVAEG